jgi:acyl-CoA synthetase (AMP-forming)/AMP-acid ligase II
MPRDLLEVGNIIEPISGRRWSSEEISRQVAARVRHYQISGVSSGDRAFLHFGNRLEFFADLLSIWLLGACAIPLDSRLTAFEVETLAKTAVPRLSIIDDKTDPAIAARMSSLDVRVVNSLDVPLAGNKTLTHPSSESPVRPEDDALILFTSGTTGIPKGVVHTHRSLQARWTTLRIHLGLEAYRRTLCLLPTYFGHGLICNSLFPWLFGQDLYITPPFSSDVIVGLGSLIDEYEITFLSSVPSLWGPALKMAKSPSRRTLKRIHCGSEPLSADTWKKIQGWASIQEVFNAYGITETGSWVAGTTLSEFVPEDGLIGDPWGAVIKILKSRETSGPPQPEMECKTSESGYVWINTPALMRGYFQQAELTRQVVCQGWFVPGDIGFFDECGRLYLKGREREEINKGGMKIYPADVDAVAKRFDRTVDVCTFGFDDPLYGQNVGMAVALRDSDKTTIRELYQWMRRDLAEHKIPVRWYLMDSVPRNSRGKINRSEVMKHCAKLVPLPLQEILHPVAKDPV